MPPAPAAFSFLSCPHPPSPLPLRGRGRFLAFFMQGASPLASPRLGGARHLHDQRFLFVYGVQCRQPRRGGTGGEELRRLRWSSPPGQGAQVPPGARRPSGHHSGRASQCRRGLAAPPGTTAAGIACAAGGKLPPPPSKIFLPPPIFIFCSPIYGILKQEKPEGV